MEKSKPIDVRRVDDKVILTVTDQIFGHTLEARLVPAEAKRIAALLLAAAQ